MTHSTPPASADAEVMAMMADPATSEWVRQVLRTAMQRDCVDAANDAEVVAAVLARRVDAYLAGAGERPGARGFSVPRLGLPSD